MIPFPVAHWSASSVLTVLDSQTSDLNNYMTNLGTGQSLGGAQSFTGNGKKLGRARFYINKNSTPVGNISCVLYAHSGTYGTSSVPTGSILTTATTTIAAATVTGSVVGYNWEFDGTYTLSNGTHYCIAIEYAGDGDGTHRIQMWGSGVSMASGNGSYNNTPWAAHGGGVDFGFVVYYWS